MRAAALKPPLLVSWYEYSLRDHLGNTCITFTDLDSDGTIGKGEPVEVRLLSLSKYASLFQYHFLLPERYNIPAHLISRTSDLIVLNFVSYEMDFMDIHAVAWPGLEPERQCREIYLSGR